MNEWRREEEEEVGVRVLGVETQGCGEIITYDEAVVVMVSAVAGSIRTQLGPIIQILGRGACLGNFLV